MSNIPTPQTGVDSPHESHETSIDFVCQTKLAPCDVSQAGMRERESSKPSELVQSSGGFSTPITDSEQYAVADGPHTYVVSATRARQLETALAQSEAGNAKLREAIAAPICGQPALTYIARQFPATVGHIPLRDWLGGILIASATTAGAETLAELRDLRERLAKAEGERDEAKHQREIAWERAAENYRAYDAACAELSTARESADKLAGALEAVKHVLCALQQARGDSLNHYPLMAKRLLDEHINAALAAHRNPAQKPQQ